MTVTSKQIQPAEKVVQSLLAYREELLEVSRRMGRMSETLLKINSCLYGEYPPVTKEKEI